MPAGTRLGSAVLDIQCSFIVSFISFIKMLPVEILEKLHSHQKLIDEKELRILDEIVFE